MAGARLRGAGRAPEEGAIAVDLGEVDAQLVLLVEGGDLQHPGCRVDARTQRWHALHLLRGRPGASAQHRPLADRVLLFESIQVLSADQTWK